MAQTSFSMSRLVDDLLSELPELFGPADRSKEIGLAAIFLYYHSIVALVERNPKYGALPPVLISTLSVLAGLGLVHSAVGPEVTAELVEYFNPSVQFLGNYMSLWLVPPMVLLPSAISRIPNAKAVTWVKLIVVHFSLWALSVSGASLLSKLLHSKLHTDASSRPSGLRTVLGMVFRQRSACPDSPNPSRSGSAETITSGSVMQTPPRNISNGSVHDPGPTSPFPSGRQANGRRHENGSAVGAACYAVRPTMTRSASGSVLSQYPATYMAPLPAVRDQDEAARVLRLKQLKLIRFWICVTVACYGGTAVLRGLPWAPLKLYRGIGSTYTPALLSTAVAVFTAGQALPSSAKKMLHPLLLTALASGSAVLLLARFDPEGIAAPLPPELSTLADGTVPGSWAVLNKFTSKARPKCGEATNGSTGLGLLDGLRAGDCLSLMLGPSCTALAFRAYQFLSAASGGDSGSSAIIIPLATSFATALGSLFLSPMLGRLVGLPSELSRVLAHRTVTSALAIPAANLTQASPELTTASVLVTGLYGASGAWLYERLGLMEREGETEAEAEGDSGHADNEQTSESSYPSTVVGSVVGATSHTIGTSELVRAKPSAGGVASISLMAAGISHAGLCSLSAVRIALTAIAGTCADDTAQLG